MVEWSWFHLNYLDPDTATTKGYLRASVDPKLAAIARVRPSHVPTKEEMIAYDGRASTTKEGKQIPSEGCIGDANRNIFGKNLRLPADPRALAVDSRVSAMRDSRVKQAVSAWRACVQKNGLRYESPVEPPHDPQWMSRESSSPATEEEKRVAGVDASCQRDVNLVGIYKTVRIAYEQRLLAEHKEELAAAAPIFRAWVEKADAIIAAE
ncbi:hypothetical protein AB0L53_32390 [Nonomuraea sp. NPDC052129]|uniref:hypothetical protein n=1 Tax=Nonomuraea sp. NPDC052129 TaxID=3154651 RepID=UPI003420A0DE